MDLGMVLFALGFFFLKKKKSYSCTCTFFIRENINVEKNYYNTVKHNVDVLGFCIRRKMHNSGVITDCAVKAQAL